MTGAGGGVFLACKDFGGRFSDLFHASTFFFFFFYRFYFLGQDQSTVAQLAETTAAECILTSCVSARVPDRFPHHAWTA